MGVTSEGACNMPEHMKRREAVYYFRRVVPKDLQAAGQPGKSADHSRLRTSPSQGVAAREERPL